ncbi:MAG: heme ABC exporter ATP-binding protein CcmA, partial [Rhodospirillales bacterium]|nr:heme ABC exporter ATP-binding protein CcmA [Rhodospirillales bacterium]
MADFTGAGLVCVRGERQVFAGVSFRIGPGGALMLVGPNGSGKSSLLRLMAGLALPVDGRLEWGSDAIVDNPEAHRGRMHYVGHLDAIKPALTVAENLVFHARLRGQRPAPADLAHALETFALAPLADLPTRFLSQGQRRRAALARLLASPAELWLLDEPTLALDADSVSRLARAM